MLSGEEWSLLVLLKELTLDLLLLLILLLVILLLLIEKQVLLLLHEELLMLLLLLKLICLLLLEILVLQSTLSGHVRGAIGQVSGGWSRRLKKRLDRADPIVGGLHQVGGLTDGRLRRAVGCGEKNGRGRPVLALWPGPVLPLLEGFCCGAVAGLRSLRKAAISVWVTV
jgi:hypothetical protein